MKRTRFFSLGLATLAFLILPAQLVPGRLCVISGSSMEPGANPGEVWWVDRRAARRLDWKRGDIIVFRQDDEIMVKRVAGVPGDVVRERITQDGRTLISRTSFEELNDRQSGQRRAAGVYETTVHVGELYVLGDNRPHSYDSRMFGTINDRAIVGILRPLKLSSVAAAMGVWLGSEA